MNKRPYLLFELQEKALEVRAARRLFRVRLRGSQSRAGYGCGSAGRVDPLLLSAAPVPAAQSKDALSPLSCNTFIFFQQVSWKPRPLFFFPTVRRGGNARKISFLCRNHSKYMLSFLFVYLFETNHDNWPPYTYFCILIRAPKDFDKFNFFRKWRERFSPLFTPSI